MYGISPKLPLIVNDLDGHYGLNKTIRQAIKQNFKNLILTSPGERVMDIQFGVGLRNYFFENFTDSQTLPIRRVQHVGRVRAAFRNASCQSAP